METVNNLRTAEKIENRKTNLQLGTMLYTQLCATNTQLNIIEDIYFQQYLVTLNTMETQCSQSFVLTGLFSNF